MKRNFIYLAGCTLMANPLLALAQNSTTVTPKTVPAPLPNVIYILADDLGYADIEPFGQQIISTPNLARMMQDGVRFMQHYGGSSVSAPSRASLMTGQHTGHTKIRGNKEISPEGQEPLDINVKTVAQLFKSAGYATGCFGKWGLGGPTTNTQPNDIGFDTFYGYLCQFKAHTYYPGWLWDNKTKVTLDGKTYSQDLIHQQVLKFIQDNKDKPFFGYFAYTLPHAGLEQPNDSLVGKYRGKICNPNSYGGDTGSMYAATNEPRNQYAGMVSRLDAYVGQIYAELEKQGVADNTLVIFTSDNGPATEGGSDPDFFNTEKKYKGIKRDMYEGGIHVPFIATWKNHIAPGGVSNHISAFYDMMPTFVELLGKQSEWTQATDGISMLPAILGNNESQAEHPHLYFEFHEYGGRQAVRQGKWKLIRLNASSTTTNTFELYNLEEDEHENMNLATQYPEKVAELYQIMKDEHTDSSLFTNIKY